MDVRKLAGLLEHDGWKNIMLGVDHLGYRFDLTAERRYGPTRWNILVKNVKRLDMASIGDIQATFAGINEQSKSWLWGRCFLYCVVAESTDQAAIEAMVGSSEKGVQSALRVKGGGGNILVADMSSKRVHGRVPSLPLDVSKFTKSTIAVLQQIV